MIGIIGAICGDVIGSKHEISKRIESIPYDFRLIRPDSTITDDSIHTIAVADWLINSDRSSKALVDRLIKWSNKFFFAGYGSMFRKWLISKDHLPYNSFGNGSAMRVSGVAWIAKSEEECIDLAKRSAEVTHNHPEGIKGAIAVAVAIFHNKNGKDKEFIRNRITELTDYNLNRKYGDIHYDKFDATCQGTVPESIICWLDSENYEDCVRKAVCLGCDTDTQAAIAGSICAANPETQVPNNIIMDVIKYGCLRDNEFIHVLNKFNNEVNCVWQTTK